MVLPRFLRDRRASVLSFFALSAIPLTGLMGAAVDYSRASAARTAMQAALDSTALAISKSATTLSAAQLQTSASAYFNALFNRPGVQNVAMTVSYNSTNGSQVVMSGSANMKTLFMNLMGIPTMAISAASTSTWGMTRLRVALVLDNTGSMSENGKMTALKTASHNLLASLKSAAQKDGDVYVSIIPFAKDVNAGASNYTASWIDWTDWDQHNRHKVNGNWVVKDHSTWNGCVMDRDQNYDTMNTAPTAGALFPAEQYSSCPAQLMPLSSDWTALNNKIDAMSPNGTTNQTIGLAWGWQSLSQSSPLSAPAMDPNYQYQQVVILLTDGLNTENRWSSDQSTIDVRTQKACDNIKAANITIYTVLVMAGNSTLLQNCASDPSKYFKLTSAEQIITTFDTIGTNLSKLRIAK